VSSGAAATRARAAASSSRRSSAARAAGAAGGRPETSDSTPSRPRLPTRARARPSPGPSDGPTARPRRSGAPAYGPRPQTRPWARYVHARGHPAAPGAASPGHALPSNPPPTANRRPVQGRRGAPLHYRSAPLSLSRREYRSLASPPLRFGGNIPPFRGEHAPVSGGTCESIDHQALIAPTCQPAMAAAGAHPAGLPCPRRPLRPVQ